MSPEKQLWTECLSQIQEILPRQTYETWFQPIVPVAVNDGHITLQVPNKFFYEWIDGHYRQLLEKSLQKITGREIKIDYSVLISGEDRLDDLPSVPSADKNAIIPQTARHPRLNERFTFDRYVEGSNNQFAKAAALAVANQPGKSNFNPLLIYGGVGLGKTHLLQAIGNHALVSFPKINVVYVSSDKFTVDFINSIKNNEVHEFRQSYMHADILLIDDIQFFDGKIQTQEQFFHIFNDLHQRTKQIVLTLDRPPGELTGLFDRLLSRFKSGLSVDIQPPDLETRIAILKRKAEEDNLDITEEIIEFLAANIQSNVRELEGAMIRLLAYSSLVNTDIDLDLAKKVLQEIIGGGKRKTISIEAIQNIVADYFDLPVDSIIGKKRTKEIALARQVAMYICRETTRLSLKTIGLHFGGRDHSTVVHACTLVENLMQSEREFQLKIKDIMKKLELSAI